MAYVRTMEDTNQHCSECDRRFSMPGLLAKHLLVIHGEEEVLVCNRCADPTKGTQGPVFKRKMNYIIHFRSQAHRDKK